MGGRKEGKEAGDDYSALDFDIFFILPIMYNLLLLKRKSPL